MALEELSPRVIREINEGGPIKPTVEDGEFYADRLIELTRLRQEVDGDGYPFEMYSSGEIIKRWVNQKGETVKEDYAEIPIREPRRGREKGLRRGIVFSIYGVRNILEDMGAGEIAKDILIWDSTMPGGNTKLYQDKNKDEQCEGK